MNGTFAKRGFQAMLTMFFVLGGLAFANRAEAQKVVVTNHQAAQQQQQWLTEQEALAVLEAEMFDLKSQLNNITPGIPAYNNLLAHLNYFMGIYQNIQSGNTVPDAVAASLAFSDAASANLSKSTRQALYDEAVDLLTK